MGEVARYTDEQVEHLLQLYRRIFPNTDGETWGQVAAYWDFKRLRRWSCLTTNFHAVTLNQIRDLDAARRAWCSSRNRAKDGEDLVGLAHTHGCGYSLGINPWTDSTLYDTITPNTKELIVLVGHDWYPIVPKRGTIEARPLRDIFPMLDSSNPQWRKYADGLPKAEEFRQAEMGLLFLNFVPDFRPPDTGAVGEFKFEDRATFGYQHCARGLRAALKLLHTNYRIFDVVTWGRPVWEALRCFTTNNEAKTLTVTDAAKRGGHEGFFWGLEQRTLRIHPFPHILPSRRHQNWKTPGLLESYCEMWKGFLCRKQSR